MSYSHGHLLQALYWIWDAFDRAMMKMVVIDEAHDLIKQHRQLEGDRIAVGVRKNEWTSGAYNIFKEFAGYPVDQTETYVIYKNPFNEVPVYVYVFDGDETLLNPDSVMYENESFYVPNPYTRFIEIYGNRNR